MVQFYNDKTNKKKQPNDEGLGGVIAHGNQCSLDMLRLSQRLKCNNQQRCSTGCQLIVGSSAHHLTEVIGQEFRETEPVCIVASLITHY